MRGLSQTLHPSILEELGLESTIDWYLSTVERQLGIDGRPTSAPARGRAVDEHDRHPRLPRAAGGAEQRGAALRRHEPRWVRLRVERRRAGARSRGSRRAASARDAARRGLGLVAMRERAALVGGTIEFLRAARAAARCVRLRGARRDGVRTGRPGMTSTRSPSCSPTITRWCAAASAACSKTTRRSPSSARRADGDEAVALAATLQPRRRRDGLRDAGHERPGRDARDPRPPIPDVAVLMLSMHSEETLVRQALDAGARGYVLKSALDLDLAAAVKRVAAGETVLDPGASQPAPLDGRANAR